MQATTVYVVVRLQKNNYVFWNGPRISVHNFFHTIKLMSACNAFVEHGKRKIVGSAEQLSWGKDHIPVSV